MTTQAERAHLAKVADLGCLICGSPAQIHHVREGQGKSQRAQHWLTVPLCREHHTGPNGIHSRKTFYMRHRLDEMDLLAITLERIYG